MNHWVYILRNPDGLLYKGLTSDMAKRLEQHNSDDSRFTAGKGPWEIVFLSEWPSRGDAQREERRIKRLNRRSLEKLING